MEELGGHYAQWNKPDKEKHHMVSLICETFKKINKLLLKSKLMETE